MKPLIVLPFCLVISFSVNAQLKDDFADGDFYNNPAWTGSASSFTVNPSKQLQLNAAAAGTGYLSSPSTLSLNARWEFWVKLSFAPSANNFARIYLISDKADLTSALHGYYIQLGESGALDAIDLYRQDSLTITRILHGKSGHTAKSSNTLRIRVERDSAGNWTEWSDTLGGTVFTLEGKASDNNYTSSGFFGVFAKFTSSNGTKFYWDDLKVEPIITDITPPSIIAVAIRALDTVEVSFSEPIQKAVAENALNYNLNKGIGKPLTAALEAQDASEVLLVLPSRLQPNIQYILSVNNVKDLAGNALLNSSISVVYETALPGDLVINEIMADPDPPVDLPACEYLELFNASSRKIGLAGYSLSDGVTNGEFPKDSIFPGEYITVCGSTNVSLFKPYGHVIGIALPGLNNTGDNLSLKNALGMLLDQVYYTDSWYGDGKKKDGGWSLERINPGDTCHKDENWKASNDISGGTPGRRNSLYSVAPDSLPPVLTNYSISDSLHLVLYFNERIPRANVASANFKLDGMAFSTGISLSDDGRTVTITFQAPLLEDHLYHLNWTGLADCDGNSRAQDISFKYYLPRRAAELDVIIDEIMADYDPPSGLPPAQYIELFNRSHKPISLNGWKLCKPKARSSLPSYLLLPDSFLILCSNSNVSTFSAYGPTLGITPMPYLDFGGDTLMLLDDKGSLIHSVCYTSDWHTDALKKNGGWSLEMKDVNVACIAEGNWSSSIDRKGGTPAKKNSVSGKTTSFVPLQVRKAIPPDSLHIVVFFNRGGDSVSLADAEHYFIDKAIGKPASVMALLPDFRKVLLTLNVPLKHREIYHLQIGNIDDCTRNLMTASSLQIGWPELPDSFDLVVNEILFNPETGGEDFVEVFNRSEKTVDLSSLYLASANDSDALVSFRNITDEGYLLFPDDYVVITRSGSLLQQEYQVPYPWKVVEIPVLPSYNEDRGRVILLRKDGLRLDQVDYSDSWHYSLLHSTKGVSLEKLYPSLPSNLSSSWHSAASTVGYATPTYRNSQYQQPGSIPPNAFSLQNDIFSPDNDGYQDVLSILFSGLSPGAMANVNIFDLEGRLQRNLVNNSSLSADGYIYWDGLTDAGNKAQIGSYIILIDLYGSDIKKQQFKLSCTLAGKF